jgi:hypothetical protein
VATEIIREEYGAASQRGRATELDVHDALLIEKCGRAYLAGSMTNLPGFGFKVFDSVADELRTRGIDVVTPSELDEAASRKAAMQSKDGDPDAYYKATGLMRGRLLARDIRIVIDDVDSVIVMPGWRQSKGARLETFTAWLHGKPVLYYPTLRRVPDAALRSAWMGRPSRRLEYASPPPSAITRTSIRSRTR